jgi:hypothetical protein
MAKKKTAVFRRKVANGSRQMVDKASGKKVFGREYKQGQAMGRKASGTKGFGQQVAKMQGRLSKLDSGKVKGKAGERSMLRGALSVSEGRKAAATKQARSSGS